MADEVLKRWDEAAQQWKVVASVNRIEVGAGGGGVGCWELMDHLSIETLNFPSLMTLTNVEEP